MANDPEQQQPSIDPSPEQRAAEVSRRIDLVREALDAQDAAGVVLRSRHAFAWLTQGGDNHIVQASETGLSFLLVTPSAQMVITPINEAARIRDEEIAGLPLGMEIVPWHQPEAVDALARRVANGRLVTEQELEPELLPVRSTLGPLEHARLRWLGSRIVDAMDAAAAAVSSGDSELVACAALEETLTRQGIRAPVVLSAADERIANYRHPLPNDRPVRSRLMLIVVGERWGLNVALTRMRDLEPPAAETARRQALTDQVLARMTAASVPGSTLGAVLGEAQAAYADAGFPDEWTLHHQGGSIGYRTREVVATPGDRTPIVAGMAFAWNPSITGAKAETTFYLDHDRGTPVTVAS